MSGTGFFQYRFLICAECGAHRPDRKAMYVHCLVEHIRAGRDSGREVKGEETEAAYDLAGDAIWSDQQK